MQWLLEGPAIEPLLQRVREEHGPDVRIVRAERVRVGGFIGFFAREQFEVTIEVDDAASRPASGTASSVVHGPGRSDSARQVATAHDGARGQAHHAAGPGRSPRELTGVRSDPSLDIAGIDASGGIDALLAAAEQAERSGFPHTSFETIFTSAQRGELTEQGPTVLPETPLLRAASPGSLRSVPADGGPRGTRIVGPGYSAFAEPPLPPFVPPTPPAARVEAAPPAEPITHPTSWDPDWDPDWEPPWEPGPTEPAAFTSWEPASASAPAEPAVDAAPAAAEAAPDDAVDVRDAALAAAPDDAAPAADRDAEPEPDVAAPDDAAPAAVAEPEPEPEPAPPAPAPVPVRSFAPIPSGPAPSCEAPTVVLPATRPTTADDPAGSSLPTVALPTEGLPTEGLPTEALPAVALDAEPATTSTALALAPPVATAVVADVLGLLPTQRSTGEEPMEEAQPEAPSHTEAQPRTRREARRMRAERALDEGEHLAERLSALGVPASWLATLPTVRGEALGHVADCIVATPAQSRRRSTVAVAPVVVVLADLDAALPVARQLAVGLGLDSDEVLIMNRKLPGLVRDRCLPSRVDVIAEVERARAHQRALVLVLPAPVGAPVAASAALADTLTLLDADEVWAVVDATRRLEDTNTWLSTLTGSRGVDAVALTNADVTVAPAAALGLAAPVVLLGEQPATPAVWVAMLAARLAAQDLS